jgi:hypothetical protein
MMTYNVSHSRLASALQELRKAYIALMLVFLVPARLAEACALASSKAFSVTAKVNLSALLSDVIYTILLKVHT